MRKEFEIIGVRGVLKALQDTRKNTEIIRQAYLSHGRQLTVNPPSSFLRFPDKPLCRIIALPAFINDSDRKTGIKWISSFPGNKQHGLARASAVLILNDYETGYPEVCMEGSLISAARTAASAVLAAETVFEGNFESASIGFCGAGFISQHILRHFVGNGWKIGKVRVFDQFSEASNRFQDEMKTDGIEDLEIVDSSSELIRSSDIIVFATDALKPHVFDAGLFSHNPLVLHISLRDLGVEVISQAVNITDDINHAVREGTSLHLTKQEVGHQDFIKGTLFDLLSEAKLPSRQAPVIFSPFGLGVLDIALASHVLQVARAQKLSVKIEDFFT